MARPKASQQLSLKARPRRESKPAQRVEVPRVTCERCGREVYALPDGSPRVHLRDTRPGEQAHSAIVPTMVDCTG